LQPGRWSVDRRARVAPILARVGALRLRIRAQRAVLAAIAAIGPGLLVVALAAIGFRSGWLIEATALRLGLIGPLVVAIAALASALRPVDWLSAATSLDHACGLHDRLSTALELADRGDDDPVARVQARDAVLALAAADARKAAPWRAPRLLRFAGAASAAAVLAFVVPLPHAGVIALAVEPGAWPAVDLPPPDVLRLSPEDREALAAQAEILKQLAESAKDPEAKRWLSEAERVVRGLLEGRLSKAEALKELAELEKRQVGRSGQDTPAADASGRPPKPEELRDRELDRAVTETIKQAVEKALQADPKLEKLLPEVAEMKKALEEKDLEKLAKLFEQLRSKDLTPEQRERLAKALERFAEKLKDSSLADKMEKLRKDEDRLRKQRDESAGGLSPKDDDRLKKTQRELEKLEREMGDMPSARRQLERLERESSKAAEDLQRRMREAQKQGGGRQQQQQSQAERELQRAMKEAMGRAADELRREARGQERREAGQMGRSRIVDIKEILRRDGEGGKGQRQEFEKRAGGREQGEGQPGDKDAQGKAEKMQLGAGQGRDPNRHWVLGQGAGRSTIYKLDPRTGPGVGQGAGGLTEQEGAGRLAGGQEQFLGGKKGEGPTKKTVFMGAAQKGFARRGWADVYVEYADVAEEMLDKEHIPAGRRALVRRYFELIRPR
jgi:hypothetical protein